MDGSIANLPAVVYEFVQQVAGSLDNDQDRSLVARADRSAEAGLFQVVNKALEFFDSYIVV